jgi:2-dehydropantoate 2-reductase
VVVQTGTAQRLVFGEVFGPMDAISPRTEAVATMLASAGIKAFPVANGRQALWEKLMYLAPYAGFTGAARVPLGKVWSREATSALFCEAVREVASLARAEGADIALPPDEVVRAHYAALPGTMRSSLLVDLENGRPSEIEAILGSILRRGTERGVRTPVLSTLYAVLREQAETATAGS